jgi:recombination DNA repair RAD52 pathway protein
MSLAIYAAPFNENSDNNNFTNDDLDSLMNKKRQTHNKTQKKYPKENFDSNKVNSVLEKIHGGMNDENDNLGDFKPPPIPQSAGVNKTIATEEMNTMNSQNNVFRTLGRTPQPNYEGSDNLDLNDYNIYGDSKTVDEYYKRVLPNYNPNSSVNKPYYVNNSTVSSDTVGQDLLLQKLNYMINLLEEQQDEKTNNVTEEVVLYSFLGIFIIFVIDSFARVGKYVR